MCPVVVRASGTKGKRGTAKEGEENRMNERVKQCIGGKFMNEHMEGSYLLLYTPDGG